MLLVHHTTDAFSSGPFSTSAVLPMLPASPHLPLVSFHSTSTNFPLICLRSFSTACSLTLHKLAAALYWNPFLCTLTYICTHAYLCVSPHLKVWDWSFHSILSQGEREVSWPFQVYKGIFLSIILLWYLLSISLSWIFLDCPFKASIIHWPPNLACYRLSPNKVSDS